MTPVDETHIDDRHGDVTVDAIDLDLELQGGELRAASADVAEYALRLGDDALILAQQLSRWIAHAPELEEDVALGNIALDLLGHARSLLRYAGSYDGRSEDDLAYFRGEAEFRSAWLFEQDNGDFARTIARQLIAATYFFELYTELAGSNDAALAAIAAKAVKRSSITATTPCSGRCASRAAPTSRDDGSSPASATSGRTCASCSATTT